jgi:hypothetical protein
MEKSLSMPKLLAGEKAKKAISQAFVFHYNSKTAQGL